MILIFTVFLLVRSVTSLDEISLEVLSRINPGYVLSAFKEDNSSKCGEDVKQWFSDLRNREVYALQMLDSAAKIPDGLLLGNRFFLGQFDECQEAVATNGSFLGKYCMMGLNFPEMNSEPTYFGMDAFGYGLCVPSSCSVDELNAAFTSINETIILTAKEMNCHSYDQTVELQVGDILVITFIGIILCIAMASTFYEVWQIFKVGNENPHELLTSFSLYRNGRAIFEVKHFPGQMECLNGIRALTMCWVVLCHDGLFGMAGPVVNVVDIFTAMRRPMYIGLSNGYLSVDTFFLLSGLLVAFVFFRDVGKTGSYDVLRSYISRYIRLTPPYAMMILLHVTIIKYMADGPMWNSLMSGQEEVCKEHWWTGLLYVHNLVNPASQEMCLVQTWYIAADMQLYLLGPLVLYPILFWPKYGGIYAAVLTVAAAFLNFGIAVANKLPFSPIFDTSGLEDRLDNYPFWSRASPWMTGICLGYIIAGIKAKKIKLNLSHKWIIVGWVVSITLCSTCMFGMLWFLDNPDFTPAQSAAFLAFHRLGWAIGVGWIIFACIFGYGGPINGFLSWGIFQPLAKLSYCAYLVHITVLFVVIGTSRVSIYENLATVIFSTILVTVLSNFAAIPLSLLIELPFGALDRYFLRSISILPFPRSKKENNSPSVGKQIEGEKSEKETA